MDSLTISFQYPFKSRCEKIADFVLMPLRYLLSGRQIYVIPTSIQDKFSVNFEEYESFPEGNFLKTALAIVTVVPGVISGFVLKVIFNFNDANKRWVEDEYQKSNHMEKKRAAKHIYFVIDPRIQSNDPDPLYWDVIKKQYPNDAKAKTILYSELQNIQDSSEEKDLYLIFARYAGRTINIFGSVDSQLSCHKYFLECKGFQRKTIILDYTFFEPPETLKHIESTEMKAEQFKDFPEMKEHTVEARSLEIFNGTYRGS